MPRPAFKRVEELFHQAATLASTERSTFLETACAGDAELRAAVDELLQHDAQGKRTESFLVSPVATEAAQLRPEISPLHDMGQGRTSAGEASLPCIPGYEVLQELGRGGMGVVYRARQIGLNRIVALKMLLPDSLATPEMLARFRSEAEALARLHHPNIVPIYDIGECQGRPYFTMEYVPGPSLAQVLDGRPQDVSASAHLLEVLARTLHAVHQAGLIHRDLKPANILLQSDERGMMNDEQKQEGTAAASAFSVPRSTFSVPKITDFGLVKDRTAGRKLTQSGMTMGTPCYMAPEQARSKRDVGPAVDIYALGSILYEMLTGRPPFDGATAAETIAQLLRDEPLPPLRLRRRLPRDLDTICVKCLEKSPRRRYASARELAEELRRFQAGEPIRARPAGLFERAYRWCRRQPLVASLAALGAFLAMAFVVTVLLYEARLATVLEATTEEQRQQIVQLNITLGITEQENGDMFRAVLHFAEAFRLDEGNAARVPNHRVRLGSALRQCPRLVRVATLEQPVVCTQLSGVGAWVVTADDARKMIQVWDVMTGQPAGPHLSLDIPLLTAALSPDGQSLATASSDGTVRLWNVSTGRSGMLLAQGKAVNAIAFHPDGRTLITRHPDSATRLWDLTAREPTAPRELTGRAIASTAFSDDNRWMFTVSREHEGQVCDVATGKAAGPPFQLGQVPTRITISPDGRRVALVDSERTLRVWDVTSARWLGAPIRHRENVSTVAFSPDGEQILTAGADRVLRVWQVQNGVALSEFPPQESEVTHARFSLDGCLVLTAGGVAGTRVWEVATRQAITPPFRHGSCLTAAFVGEGRLLLTVSHDGMVCVWELPRLLELGAPVRLEEAPERRPVALDGRPIQLANGLTVQVPRASMAGPISPPRPADGVVDHAVFSPGGDRAVLAGRDGVVCIWDVGMGKPVTPPLQHRDVVLYAAFSSDGLRLITASRDKTARVWDAVSGEPLSPPLKHSRDIERVLFSSDGTRAAVSCAGGVGITWDLTADRRPSDVLVVLAEVLSCSRIDDKQARQVLDAKALRSAWEKLQPGP